MQRWTSTTTRFPGAKICIRTDASPYGFGVILYVGGQPQAWIAEEWAGNDLEILHVTRGDAAWQAEWELFDLWLPHFKDQTLALIQTDATAALYSSARSASRTPIMNALAAELALRFESASVHVLPEHLSGTLNCQCDALSRLAQEEQVPSSLAKVRRVSTRPCSSSFFWAWPRAWVTNLSSVCGPDFYGRQGRTSQPWVWQGRLSSRVRAKQARKRTKGRPNVKAKARRMQVSD